MTTAIDEARAKLDAAWTSYRALAAETISKPAGRPSPRDVLDQADRQAALQEAAREVQEAESEFSQLREAEIAERREKAAAELVEVEAQLGEAVAEAEAAMSVVEQALGKVVALSTRRYALSHDATGRANHRLLGKAAVSGWLAWHLLDLNLRGLERPTRHQRAPLAEQLGLRPAKANKTKEKS